MNQNPLRILSLDGGGVRGISTLYILKDLMRQIARQYPANKPALQPDITPLPCQYFDLICGTSTGGFIALMLGRLRMVISHRCYSDCSLSTMPFSNTKSYRNASSVAHQI